MTYNNTLACLSLWFGYLYKGIMVLLEHRMFKAMIHSFMMATGIYITMTYVYTTCLDVRSLESSLEEAGLNPWNTTVFFWVIFQWVNVYGDKSGGVHWQNYQDWFFLRCSWLRQQRSRTWRKLLLVDFILESMSNDSSCPQ